MSIINFKGWREDLPEWRRLGRKLGLGLVLPWIFLLAWGEWIGFQVGETMAPAEAARRQTEQADLIWYSSRSANFARFKLARVAIDRPEILVVGQSRPQSFRGALFLPYTAYNLSSLSYTMASFTDLLRHLPAGYNPKVIVMALDYYLFNPACTEAALKARMLQDFTPFTSNHLQTVRDVLVYLPHHPSLLGAGFFPPPQHPTLGLSAYLSPQGFRQDGSTQWYRETGEDNPNLLATDPWWNNPTVQGDSMGRAEIRQFEQFVAEAQARGIQVVCVQLPIYRQVVQVMEHAEAAKFGILREFRARLAQGYFDRLGVLAFDYLSLPGYSENYHYFLDTVHGKEGLALAVVNALAQDPRFLKILPRLDVPALREKLVAERFTSHTHVY